MNENNHNNQGEDARPSTLMYYNDNIMYYNNNIII